MTLDREHDFGAVEAQSPPSDLAVMRRAFGMRFTPRRVEAGRLPTLPNGRPGVSMGRAVHAAMSADSPASGLAVVDGVARHDVTITAQYGIFSDDRIGSWSADGRTLIPLWQDHPVWIVTFSGDGVKVPSHGRGMRVMRHEMNVVIDAEIATVLQAFVFR